jgi:hypothetical protein
MLVACRLAGLSAIGAQLCMRQIAGNAGRRSTSNIAMDGDARGRSPPGRLDIDTGNAVEVAGKDGHVRQCGVIFGCS